MDRDDLDPVFRALADRTRRRVLDLLRAGPKTTGALCDAFPELSRFGVLKHLAILKRARLVLVRPEGRLRVNHLNTVPLQALTERWMRPYEALFASALLSLKRLAEGTLPSAPSSTAGTAPAARPARPDLPETPSRERRSAGSPRVRTHPKKEDRP
jgi:DNA-binding transcriptional ArsR family regulator